MTHPLDGAFDSLESASEQIDLLDAEIRAFADSRPWSIVHVFDSESQFWIGRLDIRSDPTFRRAATVKWGQRVKHAADDMRAALDYLVYQLSANDQAGGVHPDQKRITTQFPIFTSCEEYVGKSKGSPRDKYLAGVNEAHRAMIDLLQPFLRGNADAVESDVLTVLAALTNSAKHRVPVGSWITGTATFTHVRLQAPDGEHIPAGTQTQFGPRRGPYAIEQDAEIYRFRTEARATAEPVNFRLRIEPTFGPMGVTVGKLRMIQNRVMTVLQQFATTFTVAET